MRVLSLIALFAVAAQGATIYDALRASTQFTSIVGIVDKVPELKQILNDPNTQVTFFAPSNNALKFVPYQKPFRYLFPGILDVNTAKAGNFNNYRGEAIGFDTDKSFRDMRTEFVFIPGTDKAYQSRILRAPLRKDNGLLENGNLYYIDRQIYSCAELDYDICLKTTDDMCKGKCTEKHGTVPGSDLLSNISTDLDSDFIDKPKPTTPPAPAPADGAPAPAPAAPDAAPAPVPAPAPAPAPKAEAEAPVENLGVVNRDKSYSDYATGDGYGY